MAFFRGYDRAKHSRDLYEGPEETVRLLCREDTGVFTLKAEFGDDAEQLDAWEPYTLFSVKTVICHQFFAWLMGNASFVRLVGPDWVRMEYREDLTKSMAVMDTLFASTDGKVPEGMGIIRDILHIAKNNLRADYICWDGVETEELSCRELAEDVVTGGVRRHAPRPAAPQE